ncbi:MAG: hypothetical protein BJ554DRAFT_7138 [Olpidium bornovanus]|uniref:Uncharacterized protein n=1 Tax=Olpidium bornovanus TaxID=278681 RepID=A0A8H7ZX63_9FUNG|nr:MAG: hypothetical protein BJ554DRAFT_7138 [Olpidium bornovanus]
MGADSRESPEGHVPARRAPSHASQLPACLSQAAAGGILSHRARMPPG